MKVYLQDLKTNKWKLFEGTIKSLQKEFKKRNITIGDNIKMGYYVNIKKGVNIGNNVEIGYNVKIGCGIIIGNFVEIGRLVEIDNFVNIKDNVNIGRRVKIGYNVKIKNDVNIGDDVDIGRWVIVEDRCRIGNFVKIGYDVKIGYNVKIGNDVDVGNKVDIGEEVEIMSHSVLLDSSTLNKDYTMKQLITASLGIFPDKRGNYTLYKKVDKISKGKYCSLFDTNFIYRNGEIAEVKNPNMDKNQSCTSGIRVSTPFYQNRGDTLIEVKVNIKDIITCLESEIRCKKIRVVREIEV